MTFDEIVSEIKDRLNLTSSDSTTRIGKRVNSRYKQITSSLGINTSRRGVATPVNTVSGTATITFTMAKPEIVYITAAGFERVLGERTFDELKARNVSQEPSGVPSEYAIQSTTGLTVTLLLSPIPNSIVAINADGLLNAATLSGSTIPAFDQDFHDVLVYGGMVDELMKMEKPGLLGQAKADYEQRMSDLRYFLAKSAYLSITQGDAKRRGPRNSDTTIV